ncbi:MAG TPA: acyltransferase [Candidatus Udaeobacter sp.]|nr:acyltransferase [Candidatus Udaeobacter sp.]
MFLRDNLQALASSPASTTQQLRSANMIIPGHIPALDGLRGVAILLVMVYHFTMAYIHAFSGVLYQVSNVGWCGVDLFFVLSGFLITGILCDAKDDRCYFQKFYMRRVLRIFPLYYGFLFVLFAILPLMHHFSPFVRQHMGEQVWLWSYLTNFDYCLASHDLVIQLHLAHFWSLAVEEQFYLIWPAIIFFTKPKAAMRICSLCMGVALLLRIMLVMTHANPLIGFNLTPCRMDSLAVGALCALLVRTNMSVRKLLKGAGTITLVAGLAIAFMLCHRGESQSENPVMQSIGYTILALFFGGVLLLALYPSKSNFLSWILSCPLLVIFGIYSYGIYVFHAPMTTAFTRWFPVKTFSAEFHSQSIGLEVHVLCSIFISLLIAVLSWHLYENHFLKLKNRFVLQGKSGIARENHQAKSDYISTFGPQRIARELEAWFSRRPF